MSDKKRIIWIDSIRGVLIILVVLGHAIQSTLRDACFQNHLWNHLYSIIRHHGRNQPKNFRFPIPCILLSVLLSGLCNA